MFHQNNLLYGFVINILFNNIYNMYPISDTFEYIFYSLRTSTKWLYIIYIVI